MGLNKVMLIGNVGQEPVAKQIGEHTVCNFTLATNDRRFKGADGKPSVEWHNISCWGKLAEIVAQYVTKGTMLYLEGRIRTRKWQGDDGKDRYTTEVVADQMEILSKQTEKDSVVSSRPTADEEPEF